MKTLILAVADPRRAGHVRSFAAADRRRSHCQFDAAANELKLALQNIVQEATDRDTVLGPVRDRDRVGH